MRLQTTRPRRFLLVIGMGLAAGCSSEEEVNLDHINFHAVEEGKAYRSAQPRPDELRQLIDDFGIKTVINLRGENAGETWYDGEVKVCGEKGIAHENVRLSSQSLPSPEELADLLTTLETAERPILMHCQGGADRSGLASALYRRVIQQQSKEDALKELSEKYWHFPKKKPCMTAFVEIFDTSPEWLDAYTKTYDTIDCRQPPVE